LIELQQYQSAESIISLLLCSKSQTRNQSNEAEAELVGLLGTIQTCTCSCLLYQSLIHSLFSLGDISYAKKEYKKSLNLYKKCLFLYKYDPNETKGLNPMKVQQQHAMNGENDPSLLSYTNYMSAFNENEYKVECNIPLGAIDKEVERDIKYKECLCYWNLNEHSKCVVELELIPVRLRSVNVLLMLSKLYKYLSRKKDAIQCYKDILMQSPFCLEAIDSLVSLNVDINEIKTIIDDTIRSKESFDSIASDGWLHNYMTMLVNKRHCEYDKCEANYKKMLVTYPNNVHVMCLLAKLYLDTDRLEDSAVVFKSIRLIDSNLLENMDIYAIVLRNLAGNHGSNGVNHAETELVKLGHDLLDISQESPISWLVVALYFDYKGDVEKALAFIERAIKADSRYALAYRVKGSVLLNNNQPDVAAIAYFQANSIDRDIQSYNGMIQANLILGKNRDAIHTARDALVAMPKSSTAHVIMGDILARSPEGHAEACSAYMRAIKLNPMNKNAINNLVNILIAQNKYNDAYQILVSALGRMSCHRLRTLYAKVLVAMSKYDEAIAQLHIAISSAGTDDVSEAVHELEMLEQVLQEHRMDSNQDEGNSNDLNVDDIDVEIDVHER
jgi:anaphase-promoting complex subunit 7